MKRSGSRRRDTWRWPAVFAALSLAGMLSALIGDDGWDVASWLLLGAPVAACLWLTSRRRPA